MFIAALDQKNIYFRYIYNRIQLSIPEVGEKFNLQLRKMMHEHGFQVNQL